MEIKKKCVKCQNYKARTKCEKCNEYCIAFDDGSPFIDIPINDSLLNVYLSLDFKDVRYNVYQCGKISTNDKFTYYDQDYETIRIFPHESYDFMCVVVNEMEVN